MERFLFKKVELWIILFVFLCLIPLLIVYGASVRKVALGASNAGIFSNIAYQFAAIPSNLKLLVRGQPDYVSNSLTLFHDETQFESIQLTGVPEGHVNPIVWKSPDLRPLQPLALMFRVGEEGDEHLAIFDRERNLVMNFPVSAASLSGNYVPLTGNAPPTLLSDGSYIVHSNGSDGLYRKDICGEIIWTLPGLYHHSYSIEDGKLGILGLPEANISDEDVALWNSSDLINIIDIESGTIEKTVSILDIAKSNIARMDPFMYRDWENKVKENGVLREDVIHLNKLELLSTELAEQYPDFEAGTWMLSSRSLNMIFVLNPDTLEILYVSQGNTQAQHDPEFVGDNKIIVFNNSFDKNSDIPSDPINFSSIKGFDFSTSEWTEIYNAAQINGYTWHSGEVSQSDEGDLLMTMALQGRFIEVNRNGELLTDFINKRSDSSVYWTKHAQYITEQQLEILRKKSCE